MLSAPGLLVTAIQNKERSAERELIEHLERVGTSTGTARMMLIVRS